MAHQLLELLAIVVAGRVLDLRAEGCCEALELRAGHEVAGSSVGYSKFTFGTSLALASTSK